MKTVLALSVAAMATMTAAQAQDPWAGWGLPKCLADCNTEDDILEGSGVDAICGDGNVPCYCEVENVQRAVEYAEPCTIPRCGEEVWNGVLGGLLEYCEGLRNGTYPDPNASSSVELPSGSETPAPEESGEVSSAVPSAVPTSDSPDGSENSDLPGATETPEPAGAAHQAGFMGIAGLAGLAALAL